MDHKPLVEHVRHELSALSAEQTEDLARVLERLVAAFQPERIYVFGSQARGDATADSDIDLLIVVPEAREPAYRLAQEAYRVAAPHDISLEFVFMSSDEFAWRNRSRASLPATVLREGRTLYAA